MDGILIIDKPSGLTSHDVVARVRRIFKTKRVGHTGTLDPFATGVMVVVIGRATRLAQFLDKDVKEYVAEIQFGAETDTGDLTGELRDAETSPTKDDVTARLASVDWQDTIARFTGEQMQTPPMYSAKKIGGRKLYELARKGATVTRDAVPINIYELAILDADAITSEAKLTIRVVCSAGTYIRTLAEDIGRHIGIGAHLTKLRRTASGRFDLGQACTLEYLHELPVPENALLPLDAAVSHLPEFQLPAERIAPTRSGMSTRVGETNFRDGDAVRMTEAGGSVIAIGVFDAGDNSIRPKIVLV
ncbi:MAG: tRNA pseudouridine(55) synthase TruB [Pyrinomonadaceae bacterium]